MATIGWRPPPTTLIVRVWVPAVAQVLVKGIVRARNEPWWRSTVLTYRPSTRIWALPRVGPDGPYQRMREPVNVTVAVAPAAVA